MSSSSQPRTSIGGQDNSEGNDSGRRKGKWRRQKRVRIIIFDDEKKREAIGDGRRRPRSTRTCQQQEKGAKAHHRPTAMFGLPRWHDGARPRIARKPPTSERYGARRGVRRGKNCRQRGWGFGLRGAAQGKQKRGVGSGLKHCRRCSYQ